MCLLFSMVNFVTVPLGILFALGMVAAGCVLFLIEERSSGLLHLQLIGGLKQVVYWLSVFTWDLLCTALFIGVLMLLFWLFQDLTFPTGDTHW